MANATKEDLDELRKEVTAVRAALLKQITAIKKEMTGASTVKELYAKVKRGDCVLGQDPKTCPLASTYHYQHGCHGAACEAKVSAYYAADQDDVNGTPVKATRARKTPAAKKAPAKRTVAKKAAAPTRVAKKAVTKRATTKVVTSKKAVPRRPVPA